MSKKATPKIIISVESLPILAIALEYCVHNTEHFQEDSGVNDKMVSIIKDMLAEILATMSLISNEQKLVNPNSKVIN